VQIVGQGPLLGPLQALAQQLALADRVQFVGAVDHAALPALYTAANVFVQTSRHEAQGMALLEAAACGVPAVGTPVGVLPELGISATDEASLASALGALLADKPRRAALAQSAREQVRADYSLDGAVQTFREVYASVAQP
jgi:glycosyltransferase involved in cell wall biosynthesis